MPGQIQSRDKPSKKRFEQWQRGFWRVLIGVPPRRISERKVSIILIHGCAEWGKEGRKNEGMERIGGQFRLIFPDFGKKPKAH